jgi:hypothetical protein
MIGIYAYLVHPPIQLPRFHTYSYMYTPDERRRKRWTTSCSLLVANRLPGWPSSTPRRTNGASNSASAVDLSHAIPRRGLGNAPQLDRSRFCLQPLAETVHIDVGRADPDKLFHSVRADRMRDRDRVLVNVQSHLNSAIVSNAALRVGNRALSGGSLPTRRDSASSANPHLSPHSGLPRPQK